ncbi:coiled-coil domain-containing protein 117 [Gastrophryne carolinensis]
MDFNQSDPFLQKTSASGIVGTPFHGTSSSQFGQINSIPGAVGLHNNGSCFNMCSPFTTHPVAEADGSMAMFLGNTVPVSIPVGNVGPQISTGLLGRVAKKHKHDRADYDCPSKKRKLSSSPVFEDCCAQPGYAGNDVHPGWNSTQAPPPEIQPLGAQAAEMQPILTEDMEETTAESPSDAALRRIRDIESRLVTEDDDDEVEESGVCSLPTLVMSDILAESLKQGLDESLTKKIVDSISRPSMELVLWRPQPELIDRLQSFTSNCKDDSGASKKSPGQPSEAPFLRNLGVLGVDRPQTVTIECDSEPMWNKDEEEMEL